MLNRAYFPQTDKRAELAIAVVQAFEAVYPLIASDEHTLPSNDVLAHVAPQLVALGFTAETGKKGDQPTGPT